jgi:DNA-binding transcriptional ArsR family regulator
MDTSGESTPLSIEMARKRLYKAVSRGFSENHPVLIDALPSVGKSYGVIEWAATTGNPLTVFTARHDLFDQYEGWAKDQNLRYLTLPSFHKDCETANGDHGKSWQRRVLDTYEQTDLLPGEIHRRADDLFDEPLPCQQEGDCSYFEARDFDPAGFDVLIGHYRHAHVPERVEGRYIVFDEFPEGDFLAQYSPRTVSTAVSTYLATNDSLPFSYLKDLKESRRNPERKQAGIDWFEQYNPTLNRDVDGAVTAPSGDGHPEAPTMTYAILTAEDLANRWEYARLPDGRTAVVNPKDESLTVLNRPTLNGAESVIALDGTPTVEKWRLMLGDDLRREAIMSDTEKEGYLRNTLGVRVVQTTVAANHYSGRSAISVTPDVDLVLFEGVRLRENIRPALITSKSALREYEENGLSEVVGETEHYGNLKGSNKFARTRVGIVAGSPHYGDDYIKRWSALAGESAQEAYDKDGVRLKGMAQDFGDYGNRILRGMRENEVLQAILRFGRDGGGATVYVHTAALPEWVERDGVVPEIRPWPPGMYQILDAIRETGDREWRTSDITSRVSVSEQQVREHLHTLAEFGFVSYRREGRGYTWSDESLAEIGQRGHVRFSD